MAQKVRPIPKPERPRHFIREWRKYRGLTQERLAERVGMSNGMISQLETGIVGYTQSTLENLAAALSCEPGDLLLRDPNMEGAVLDLMRILQAASEADRGKAMRIVRELLATGT